jgi:hypothetical protein
MVIRLNGATTFSRTGDEPSVGKHLEPDVADVGQIATYCE